MQLREHLLLWWGKRHIGEVIRRSALRRELRRWQCAAGSIGAPLRVLDAGCGRGDNAIWAAANLGVSVDAVDMDPARVALVQRRAASGHLGNLRVWELDIEHAPFHAQPSRYGIVYSVDVFEHLRDPAAALAGLAGVLADDGTIVLHIPRAQQRRYWKRFAHYDQHDHERDGFEPEEIVVLARNAGLSVERLRHTFGPLGALAWELFHIAQGVGRWCALGTYPVPWFLAQLDGWFRWKRGNGMLVVLRKPTSAPLTPST